MQTRQNALNQWLKSLYPDSDYQLNALAGDASFRRYYRLDHAGQSLIVMDAPPDKIEMRPFVEVQGLLSKQGIIVPQIYAVDATLGFALLEDLGDRLFQDALEQKNLQQVLYETAIKTLIQIQKSGCAQPLTVFDRALMLEELNLFQEWFLKAYLGLILNKQDQKILDQTFEQLSERIALQPQVLVHRDYHSRNIMLLTPDSHTDPKLGIIDFQDAVLGPVTYDLVSLLKDGYVHLPHDQLISYLRYYYEHNPPSPAQSFAAFQRDFDWCGLQRHMKIMGIFSRLHLRDGKSNYLQSMPTVYRYIKDGIQTYPEFHELGLWLQHRIEPFFENNVAL